MPFHQRSLSLSLYLSFILSFSSSIHPSPNQLTYSSRWFSIEGRGLPEHCLIFFSSQFPHGQIYSSQRKEQRDKELSLLAKQCPTQRIIFTVGLGSSWVEKGVRGCNRMLVLGLVVSHRIKYWVTVGGKVNFDIFSRPLKLVLWKLVQYVCCFKGALCNF